MQGLEHLGAPSGGSARSDIRTPGEKLVLLEVGRAVAALIVVLHHADQASQHFGEQGAVRFAIWGQYGVDFFFVLSGFIIAHVHRFDAPGGASAWRYLSKRVTRIYVPYLPVALAYAALLFALQPTDNRYWSLIGTLTLWPMERASALTVAWTLSFEMLFYALFLLRYISHSLFWAASAIWFGFLLMTGMGLIATPASPPLLEALADPIVTQFFCGVAAAYILHFLPSRGCGWVMAAGILGLGLVVLYWSGQRALLGPPLGLVVLALAMIEVRGMGAMMRGAVFLGASSYAIYLVHSPVVSIVAQLTSGGPDRWVVITLCVILGIALGILYHVTVERPAIRWFRHRLTHREMFRESRR
jgi:exopolysaccharide production protein ExoZ